MIRNPVLPGFNPDPSLCRVGSDYYLATSTFEWFPGVQIHHSRDLVNWRLVSRPLNRASQLDMRGNPDSCGVWAPALSYADGQFWLIYTDMKRYDGNYKDSHNYLVTCPDVEGDWSDPVYINSSGFDPSLFHDDDGRKWFLNMVWDHHGGSRKTAASSRHGADFFGGILLQEYDHGTEKLVGPVKNIFRASPHGFTEAPHLSKRGGWYYLVTAEGGTGYEHAVTHCRARTIDGPYELHPGCHVLTAKHAPDSPLQRVGHGQFVELDDGSVYHSFLCSRPLPGTRRSPMGRETGIERCRWDADGWLYPETGSPVPRLDVPGLADVPPPGPADVTYQFSNPTLPMDFQWLRSPEPARLYSLAARPGWLRLYGRESIGSWFEQALIARRQSAFTYRAETALDFSPEGYQQLAGLTTYYNRNQFYYLYVSADEDGHRLLNLQGCPGGWPDSALRYCLDQPVPLPSSGLVRLRVAVDGVALQFGYAFADEDFTDVGPVLDATKLTDEGGRGEHASFTGAFVGMAAQDLTGRAMAADFTYFRYREG